MNILGAIGQQYMFILLILLFLGLGLVTWAVIESIFVVDESKGTKNGAALKPQFNKNRGEKPKN